MFDDLVEESEPAEDDGEGVAVAPDGFRLTDAGNAERFIAMTGGEVRFVHQWARWIVFREGRWIVDVGDALVTEKAKAVPRSLMAMIPNLSGDERDRVFKLSFRTSEVSFTSPSVTGSDLREHQADRVGLLGALSARARTSGSPVHRCR